jgi:predicted unusual protein kinase regulating ubiquinone biosynthesis (AarF/ABC1/UbiB family)
MVSIETIARRAVGEEHSPSSREKGSSPGTDSHTDPVVSTSRADRDRTERLEALALLRQRLVENGQASLLNSHRYAPANHPCVEKLSETVRWAAHQLGIQAENLSIHVFQQYPTQPLENIHDAHGLEAHRPQAFILPESGAIFINVQMLEALSWSSQLVNAVLYHEVAHLQLKRDLMTQIALETNDPIEARLETYEMEYHCDRLAALLSSQRREDPRSISIALTKLSEYEEQALQEADYRSKDVSLLEAPLFVTHPATARRIRENAAIVRHLPTSGLRPDSALTPISDSDLPIKRPFGDVVDEENTLGIFFHELRDGKVEDPPLEFGNLIEQGQEKLSLESAEARSNFFSDWVAHLWGFLETEDGEQFKLEFAEELRQSCNSDESAKQALGELLENINLARFLRNGIPCSADELFEDDFSSDVPLHDALDLLVRGYIEFRDAHVGPLEVLTDLVAIGERGDRKFGVGSVFGSTEVFRLCVDVAYGGSDEEKMILVALADRSPSLQQAIQRCTTSTKLRREIPNIQSLTELLSAHSKTMFRTSSETDLTKSLEAHTLERWIGPSLRSREVCELPICVRREPGCDFKIEQQTLRSGRKYHLIIVGDSPIDDSETSLLHQHLTEAIDRGLSVLSSRLDIPVAQLAGNRSVFLDTIAAKVSGIQKTATFLQGLTPKTIEEKRDYMGKFLSVEFEGKIHNRTSRAKGIAHSASSDDKIDAQLQLDLHLRMRNEGCRPLQDDLVGLHRAHFSQASYAQTEELSPQHILHQRLWHDLYGAEYSLMSLGLHKARFLTESYPIKTRYRDQLICESLEMPPLRYLDDMGSLSEVIQGEESIDTLVLLRDSLHSQELAQVAEVRLFELFEKDPTEFLSHPTIATSLPDVLKPLPDVLRRVVGSDDQLRGVLVCFAYASRERDRHLVRLRDSANNREEKEALGALLSDPNLASTQGVVLFQKRQDADTVFASMAALGPYDKTQALLYFMGRRSFFSPIDAWLGNRNAAEWIGDCDTPLIPERKSATFDMPDVLIRAQKAFGIAIATAENLKAGILNERTLTDLLRESLYGRNGVASEPEMLQTFFTLAGRTLIQQNPQLAALQNEQKKRLASFLGFAFANCPESRLPSVILKVWEATKSDSKDAPTLVATILSKLGPAFVKFGQRLAQLDIDAEYKRAFRKLCSENAQVDTSFVYHNLSVSCPPGIFDESHTGRKIAEGSMAATFEGTLKDSGKRVCIKMIHPSIQGDIDEDIKYISKLVEYMNREQSFPGLTIPANTPQIIRQQLTDQANTQLEMQRTEHLRHALQSRQAGAVTFVVPEVLREVSGEGVIVYELMPSYELDKEEISQQGFVASAISHEVGLEILRLLVEERHYQSDVNLGNFGVVKDPESGSIVYAKNRCPMVVWYDAGAVEEIHPDDQKLLLQIILAAARNPAEIPDLVSKLVHAEGALAEEVHVICRNFGEKLGGTRKLELTKLQEQLQEFIDALSEVGLGVQDKWVVIANTLSMAAPLLSGVDEKRLTNLLTKAMQKHGLITKGELLTLRFMSFWK